MSAASTPFDVDVDVDRPLRPALSIVPLDVAPGPTAESSEPRDTSLPGRQKTRPGGIAATDMMHASDPMLVDEVEAGQADALAELYRRHNRALFSQALRVLRSRELAADVVQEIFVRLWSHPQLFDGDRGCLRAFLLSQTRSRAVDVARSESARRIREDRDAGKVRTAYDLQTEAMDLAAGRELRKALATLPDGERQAIALAYFGDHTYRDVARVLGVPEGTVKSRIRSGLSRLQTAVLDAGIRLG